MTYAKAVNAALLIESGKIEWKAFKEAAKKLKTRGSFSNDFSFGGGYGPQSQQQTYQGGVAILRPNLVNAPVLRLRQVYRVVQVIKW